MAKIAIVGTRESGKTVLMTVLAKRYQTRIGNNPFLKAMNRQTVAFTEKNWHRLTQERDWPPLTPPGELLHLHWALEHEGDSHEIHLVDFAGETFRTVFGKHNISDPEVRSQLAADPLYGPLLAYLDQADVVALLVNLRDYVDAPTASQGMELMLENQFALRGSLDYLTPRLKNRVASVFTQIDQYPELVNDRRSWRDVMRKHLPATQISEIYGDITYLGISAIPETELGQTPDGQPFLRPAINFQSWHMEELMGYLVETCKAIQATQLIEIDTARAREALLEKKRAELKIRRDFLTKWAIGIGVSGLLLTAYSALAGGFLLAVAAIMTLMTHPELLTKDIIKSFHSPAIPIVATPPPGQAAAAPVALASRRDRLIASLIDWILLVGCYRLAEASLVLGIPAVIGLLTANMLFIARSGQTIGKIAAKIKVVDYGSGKHPGFWRIIIHRNVFFWCNLGVAWATIALQSKELGEIFYFIGQLALFVDSLWIFQKQRRCLHDFVAKTKVVKIAPVL